MNTNFKNNDFLTVKQLADILNVSRIAIFKKIKNGQLVAQKYGKTYLIPKSELVGIIDDNISEEEKNKIKNGVYKVIKDYGETLKMLGKE
jgi:excisionase family DNA binding protein